MGRYEERRMLDRMTSQVTAEVYKERMVGKRYRHFKGGVYVVSDVAVHSETGECMVIYKSFDKPSLVWARPLTMFLSEVDRKKYPNVKQELRFEQLSN